MTSILLSFGLFLAISLVLSRFWVGILHNVLLKAEPDIHEDSCLLHSPKLIVGTLIGTAVLFALSLKHFLGMLPYETVVSTAIVGTIFILIGISCVLVEWRHHQARATVFSVMVGTAIALVLISFYKTAFGRGATLDPYAMALSMIVVVLTWRLLFGPWSARVKATVLGTFLFWVVASMLVNDHSSTRNARLIATGVAIIPALIWCKLFLREHSQRMSLVFLMFFAGMLSTAPILFYDHLVRNGIEMQFFFFRIVPESFHRTSSVFVSSNLIGLRGVHSSLAASFVSFLMVGVIEEISKFWVMKRSGRKFFTSIDDVLQLSIIVAIGFAFAENILNPTYFVGFVRQYLLSANPDWIAFIGNVSGRAVLTNMVHIVSTGVIGYFYGKALFAGPHIREQHEKGRYLWLADSLHYLMRFNVKRVYRREMLITGLILGIVLHGMFNFLVTFPEIVPGKPRTLGDLFGGGFLDYVPILMVPSLFYVVGGFWLLTELFLKKSSLVERGHVITTDAFVRM